MVREDDPPMPSTRVKALSSDAVTVVAGQRASQPQNLAPHVRGDLDWITMKALERDRHRRYESTSAMATDIERYLNHEPVEAVPPTAMYGLRKFLRRRRSAAIAVACLVLMLLVGTTMVTRKVLRRSATQEARIADLEQNVSGLLVDRDEMLRVLKAHATKPDGIATHDYRVGLFAAENGKDRLEHSMPGQLYAYGTGGTLALPFDEVPLAAFATITTPDAPAPGQRIAAGKIRGSAYINNGKVTLALGVDPSLQTGSDAGVFVYVLYRKRVKG